MVLTNPLLTNSLVDILYQNKLEWHIHVDVNFVLANTILVGLHEATSVCMTTRAICGFIKVNFVSTEFVECLIDNIGKNNIRLLVMHFHHSP